MRVFNGNVHKEALPWHATGDCHSKTDVSTGYTAGSVAAEAVNSTTEVLGDCIKTQQKQAKELALNGVAQDKGLVLVTDTSETGLLVSKLC
jgi:hypothetical protein